jgi:hypothetical protein
MAAAYTKHTSNTRLQRSEEHAQSASMSAASQISDDDMITMHKSCMGLAKDILPKISIVIATYM